MVYTIVAFAILALLFGLISWKKIREFKAKRQFPPKQWEGTNPDNDEISMKITEQKNLKYRGFGQIM